jgi:hypothetical protein
MNNLERRIDSAGFTRFIWLASKDRIPLTEVFALLPDKSGGPTG